MTTGTQWEAAASDVGLQEDEEEPAFSGLLQKQLSFSLENSLTDECTENNLICFSHFINQSNQQSNSKSKTQEIITKETVNYDENLNLKALKNYFQREKTLITVKLEDMQSEEESTLEDLENEVFKCS